MLKDFLIEKGYSKIKLKLTKTNHFEIRATINGVKGRLFWIQVLLVVVLVLKQSKGLN